MVNDYGTILCIWLFLLNDMKSLMSKWLAEDFKFLTQKTMSFHFVLPHELQNLQCH